MYFYIVLHQYYLGAVGALHPLLEAGSEAGGRQDGHQAAVVVLGGGAPGHGGGAGAQQTDAHAVGALLRLLHALTVGAWNTHTH